MTRTSVSALLAAAVVVATPVGAQPTRTPIDVAKLGPQVGEQVPQFSLPDQRGQIWTRQSIVGPKGAMLVFFRSADW